MTLTRFLPALLLLMMSATSGAQAEVGGTSGQFFTLTFGNLPEELELANEQGKLGLLLFFESDYCPYCQRMKQDVLSDPQVQSWYGQRFTSIAVDIHGDIELVDFDNSAMPSKAYSKRHDVFVTPTLTFIDADGGETYRYQGMIATPEEFLLLGSFVEGGHFNDSNFKDFAKSRGLDRANPAQTTHSDTGESK